MSVVCPCVWDRLAFFNFIEFTELICYIFITCYVYRFSEVCVYAAVHSLSQRDVFHTIRQLELLLLPMVKFKDTHCTPYNYNATQ